MMVWLCFFDAFGGAGTFAGAAVDAFVGIDNVGGVSGGDGAYGANFCAGTAGDAGIRINKSGHNYKFLCVLLFKASANLGILFDFKNKS